MPVTRGRPGLPEIGTIVSVLLGLLVLVVLMAATVLSFRAAPEDGTCILCLISLIVAVGFIYAVQIAIRRPRHWKRSLPARCAFPAYVVGLWPLYLLGPLYVVRHLPAGVSWGQ